MLHQQEQTTLIVSQQHLFSMHWLLKLVCADLAERQKSLSRHALQNQATWSLPTPSTGRCRP